jgi:Zn-dependent protease
VFWYFLDSEEGCLKLTMLEFIYLIFALVLLITFHEFAHAYAASFLGDPTARHKGRVTLNPLAHLDPVGTILMFVVGIGWGKPVPVNRAYFKKPIAYEALVALAGPMMNLVIALIVLIPLKYFINYLNWELALLLSTIFDVSILLFAFNMLPFPPLDGSKFLQLLIPGRWQHHYQWYLANAGLYFMCFLLIDNFILAKYFHFSVLSWLMGWIIVGVKTVLFLGG